MTDTNTIPITSSTPSSTPPSTMNESKHILSTDPDVYTIDNYLTEAECQHFIDLGKPRLKRALVSGSNDGYVSNGRTGQNCWIRHDTDEITKRVGEKIAQPSWYSTRKCGGFPDYLLRCNTRISPTL